MLDLNLASSGDPPAVPDELRGGEGFEGEPSDDSSLLNAEPPSAGGDDDSCSTRPAAALHFDILKGGKEKEEALVSRQLFPLPLAPAVALPSWVDPSFGRAGVAALPMTRALPHEKRAKRSRRGPQSRSSQYRGVTFYRRTGRWESHIWDCGKQVYLGGFDTAHAAARAYDRAAIKFRGVDADINFILSDYEDDMKLMNNLSKDEFVHVLRRQSAGISRGSSKYRGVTPHQCGLWEDGMGKLVGKNAYNKADIYCNERKAVTNFEPITYERELLPEGDSEAVSDDLDLNLRISQPNIRSSKRDVCSIGIHFKLDPLKAPDSEKARIDAQSSHLVLQPHHFPAVLEHPYVRTSQLQGFFPNTEVRAADKSHKVVPFALPNLMWQMPSSRPLLPFLSAASSGFLTTTKTAACPPQPLPSSHHPALHLPPSIL